MFVHRDGFNNIIAKIYTPKKKVISNRIPIHSPGPIQFFFFTAQVDPNALTSIFVHATTSCKRPNVHATKMCGGVTVAQNSANQRRQSLIDVWSLYTEDYKGVLSKTTYIETLNKYKVEKNDPKS